MIVELFLSENNIADISFLEGNTSLSELFIFKNQVTNVSSVRNTNITRLFIHDNQISDVSVLYDTQTIEHITLENNRLHKDIVSYMTRIAKLNKENKALRYVTLFDLLKASLKL